MPKQHTIADKVVLEGVGLHTGSKTKVEISPLEADRGVVFERKDVVSAPFRASLTTVLDPQKFRRRTCLGTPEVPIQTVEHLMAALHLLGIDNVKVDVWGEELPGLDGSAKAFAEAFLRVGKVEQAAERKYVTLKEPIFINDGMATIAAFPSDELRITYSLKYDNPVIGTGCLEVVVNGDSDIAARDRLYEARTFCLEEEAKNLLSLGLGKGSNYENTLVVSQNGIMNNRLRFPDEFVRHKMMDLIGDLYLAGPVKARVIAAKSGHTATIKLLEKLTAKANGTVPEGILSVEEIMKIIPHRFPFLLIDRIVELDKGKRAVGVKSVTMNEHFFQGHFPGRPVMPGVLIIEAMAQTAAVAVLSCEEHRGKLAFFMAVNNAKFRKPVVPGDQLRFEVEVVKTRSKTGIFNAKAYVAEALVAEGELMFAFVD